MRFCMKSIKIVVSRRWFGLYHEMSIDIILLLLLFIIITTRTKYKAVFFPARSPPNQRYFKTRVRSIVHSIAASIL